VMDYRVASKVSAHTGKDSKRSHNDPSGPGQGLIPQLAVRRAAI
jgi:hypothetical protein